MIKRYMVSYHDDAGDICHRNEDGELSFLNVDKWCKSHDVLEIEKKLDHINAVFGKENVKRRISDGFKLYHYMDGSITERRVQNEKIVADLK